jgi:HK97 family phage major capsid protein
VDASGGYAVPSVLMPGILSAMTPASTILQAGGGIIDVSQTAAKSFATAAIDAIPTAAWRNEAAAVAESSPTFRLIPGVPRSLAFFFKVSRELLADAPNMNEALRTVIAQSFARELDRTGLRGTGVAPQPKGILGTTGVNAVTNTANGASLATLAYANFLTAVQLILEDDAPMPPAAILSPRSRVVLGSLADTTTQPRLRPEILRNMQFLATSQIPNTLTEGTSNDCTEIYVGTFSYMSFIMRERPSIQLLTELYAGTGELAFLGHVRADVALMYPKAFATVVGVRP